MPPPQLAELCRQWRNETFSLLPWQRDNANPIAPGEAGGFLVRAQGFERAAYLKPGRAFADQTPRAANEKIVSDIGSDVGLSVPPVLLYRRPDALIGEEANCCVSLIMYSEHHNWELLWNLNVFPEVIRLLVRDALSRYSRTFALDLLIGQTDRNNGRNVVLGADAAVPPNTEFLFLDHAYTLNHQNRWHGDGWRNMQMVPVPDVFRQSLRKEAVLQAADQLRDVRDGAIRDVVERIPEDYMDGATKQVVVAGLNGRKHLLRSFVEQNL